MRSAAAPPAAPATTHKTRMVAGRCNQPGGRVLFVAAAGLLLLLLLPVVAVVLFIDWESLQRTASTATTTGSTTTTTGTTSSSVALRMPPTTTFIGGHGPAATTSAAAQEEKSHKLPQPPPSSQPPLLVQPNFVLEEEAIEMETAIVVVVKVHIPIVVQLSGELGNHLSKLAAGIGVALELQKGNNNYINNTNAPIQSHNDDDDDPMSRLLARRNDQSTDTTKEPPSIPQQQLQPPPPHSHYYYQIVPRLVLKHQQHTTKWESAVQVLHQCFPYWTTMNVSEASSTLLMSNEEPTTGRTNNATTSSTTENSNTSGNNHINNLNNNNALWDDINSHEAAVHNATRIDAAIQSMVAATVQAAAQDNSLQTIIESMRRDARTFGNGTITIDWTSPITFYSDYLTTLDVYMDRYFDVYRRVFAMIRSDAQISSSKSKDKSSFLRPESVSTFPLSASSVCCSPDTAPIPGEVVFYLRGFVTEMPRKGISMGYEEASPETLLQILAHPSFSTAAAASNTTSASTPKPKEKLIAIVSRYAYVESVIHPYIDVLSDAGWIVRVVHHNATAAVDFCFLASTLPSNRLIGLAKSTFFLWAAVLSSSISNDSPVDASRITAYSINSTAKRAWAKAKNFPLRDDYMWTHPALTNEWQFPLYSQ